jgi:hypothetical protein
MEAYYASECVIDFEVSRGADLQGEVMKSGGVRVVGDGSAQWKSDTSLVITQNVEVPFAFNGLRVPG